MTINPEIKPALDFFASYKLLDLDLGRLQRRNKRLRNSFLILLTQIILIFFIVGYQ